MLRRDPAVILDGGHNPQCFEALARNLAAYFPGKKIRFVLGVLADKEYPLMADCVAPLAEGFYTVTPDSPRALPAGQLAECLSVYDLPVAVCGDPAEGMRAALREAKTGDVICAAGSLFLADALRTLFGLEPDA